MNNEWRNERKVVYRPTFDTSQRPKRSRGAGRRKANRLIPAFQNGHEGLLRDVHAADALHALLAFLLFLQQLAFAGDVAAVALGGDVLADGLDGLAGDDLAADGGLEGDLEEVLVDLLLEADEELSAAGLGLGLVDDDAEGIDAVAVDEDVHLDQLAGAEADQVVVHRPVPLGRALELVVEVVDHLGEGDLVGEDDAVGADVLLLLVDA